MLASKPITISIVEMNGEPVSEAVRDTDNKIIGKINLGEII